MIPGKMRDFIEVYDRVLPDALCKRIIHDFSASDGVRIGRTGGGVDEISKSSLDLSITSLPEWSAVTAQVWQQAERVIVDYVRKYPHLVLGGTSAALRDPKTGQLIRLDPEFIARLKDSNVATLFYGLFRRGPLNVQCYPRRKGHYSWWHSEIYPAEDDYESLHRALFLIFYLNDVADGGVTEFFYQPMRVQPVEGRLLIAPAAFTHTHRGTIPESADKYVLASWLLFRRNESIPR